MQKHELTINQKAVIESFKREFNYIKRIELDEYTICHSELAIHTRTAGKKVFLAFMLGENRYGLLLTIDGRFVHGCSLKIWHKLKRIAVC